MTSYTKEELTKSFSEVLEDRKKTKEYLDSQNKESLQNKEDNLKTLQQRLEELQGKISELSKDIESKKNEKEQICSDTFGDIKLRTSQVIAIDTEIDLSEKTISQMESMVITCSVEIDKAKKDVAAIKSYFSYQERLSKIKPFVDDYKQSEKAFNDSKLKLDAMMKETGLSWNQINSFS